MKYINDTILCLYDSKRPFSGNLSIGLIIPPFQKNRFYCHAVITATNHRQPCDAGLGFSGCKTTPESSTGLLGRCQGHSAVPETNLKDAIVLNFVLKTFGVITYMNGKSGAPLANTNTADNQ